MPSLASRSIELRHLRYFVAVAEERHFTRAAERLHMAQPPLSAQIRQLEQRLGATLFERAPGHVDLTPSGEALLEAAYATLGALDDGVEAVRAVSEGRRGRVRVAVSATVPLGPALAGVSALARRAPDVRVDVLRVEDAVRELAQGRADVAFVRGPLRDRSLPRVVVAAERRLVLAPAGHRLARLDQATLGELAAKEIGESREGGPGARGPSDRPAAILEHHAGALGVGRPVESVEELLARVAAGDAVAVVPEGVAGELPAGLAAVPLADAPHSEILIAGPREDAGAAAAAYADAVSPGPPLRLAA